MKTEQHKVIAEAMGIGLDKDGIIGYVKDNRQYKIDLASEPVWNPETNAEQTLIVLEKVIFKYLQISEGLMRVSVSMIKNKVDFQTAVCIVAFEIAETLKK